MDEIIYGEDHIFDFALIGVGVQDFDATIVAAAGDAKIYSESLAPANPAARAVAFTSGSEAPSKGDELEGATSASLLTVIGFRLTSGTWGAGTAAGWLFVKNPTAPFQAENLDNNTSLTANVMTISGAIPAAGLFVHVSGGMYAIAATALETVCKQGWLRFIDSAAKAFEDTYIPFRTLDHPLAWDPRGVVARGILQSATADGVVLAVGEVGVDNVLNGGTLKITKGVGAGQRPRSIQTSLAVDDSAAIEPNWAILPAAGDEYIIWDTPPTAGVATAVEQGISGSPEITGLIAGQATIVADTNELQTDLVDGGRLDLILDALTTKVLSLPSGIAKNVALPGFEFFMFDAAGDPLPGLIVTAQRSIDTGVFAPCANAVVEVELGAYAIDLATTDLNGDVVTLIFTAAGAKARIFHIITES